MVRNNVIILPKLSLRCILKQSTHIFFKWLKLNLKWVSNLHIHSLNDWSLISNELVVGDPAPLISYILKIEFFWVWWNWRLLIWIHGFFFFYFYFYLFIYFFFKFFFFIFYFLFFNVLPTFGPILGTIWKKDISINLAIAVKDLILLHITDQVEYMFSLFLKFTCFSR